MQDSYHNKINCGGFVKQTKPPAISDQSNVKPEADQIERDEFGCPITRKPQARRARSIGTQPMSLENEDDDFKKFLNEKAKRRRVLSPNRFSSIYDDDDSGERFENFLREKAKRRRLMSPNRFSPETKNGSRVFVKEDNYGGLPDWKCTCGASVWPRKQECFKCGARRSQVTGRDSLGYSEAKKKHQDKVQQKFEEKVRKRQARFLNKDLAVPLGNSLIARSPKDALITDESSSPSESPLDVYPRRERAHKRPVNSRFAYPSKDDPYRKRARSPYRQRPMSGRFPSPRTPRSATPATKANPQICMVQNKPIHVGGFQRGRSTQTSFGADRESFSSDCG